MHGRVFGGCEQPERAKGPSYRQGVSGGRQSTAARSIGRMASLVATGTKAETIFTFLAKEIH
jgi:hypothetical protein